MIRPNVWSGKYIAYGRAFYYRISKAAELLVQYQNEEFGDRHDPAEAARGARLLAVESIKRFNGRGNDKSIRRRRRT